MRHKQILVPLFGCCLVLVACQTSKPGTSSIPANKSKVRVSVEAYTVKDIGKYQQVADRWTFGGDEQGETQICVDDASHCITLNKLRQQLR